MFRNVATKVALFAFDYSTGAPKTGDAANLTAYVSKDYGTVTVLADTSATEMSSTNAPGWYLFDVAQGETDADALLFSGKSSTSNIVLVGQMVYTTSAPPTAAQVADKILGRSLAGGEDGGRTVQDALRVLRNKSSISAGTLTVCEEDDTTPAWTAAVTTAAGDPISAIDPT